MDIATEKMEEVVVRRLVEADLQAVIQLDAKITGRRRTEYFRLKIQESLGRTGIAVSLAAELDSCFVGFLLARVYHGEFGILEPVAALDTIGVHPDFRRRGVGTALFNQLCTDLRAVGVDRLQTEAAWEDPEMLAFFQREGFRPAPRLCLDLDLTGDAGGRRERA